MPIAAILIEALVAAGLVTGLSEFLSRELAETIVAHLKHQRHRRTLRRIALIVLALVVAASAGVLLYLNAGLIVAAAVSGAYWLLHLHDIARAAFVIGAFAVAAGLFLLRKFARVPYGVLEILVAGVGLLGYPLEIARFELPWLISLFGLIYIVVRGADNVDQGFAQQRRAVREEGDPSGRPDGSDPAGR